MIRVLCVGECMIELRHTSPSTAQLGHAGDTYNTAVYLRRLADQLAVEMEVGYLTGLGDDEYSTDMRAAWAAEGVADRALVLPGRLPGLYTVRVDDRGERRFTYWRSASAARELFSRLEWVDHVDGDVIHLSGITLQLASAEARSALRRRLAELRAGGAWISLDTNYRPSGWPAADQAATAMDELAEVANIVLATWQDEAAMHDCATPLACAERLAALGVREVVVKRGADGALVLIDGHLEHIPATPVDPVVDTTAAGDAFAGGYLAARIAGRPPIDAAHVAADVAAVVVAHPGAIIPAEIPIHQHSLGSSDEPRPARR